MTPEHLPTEQYEAQLAEKVVRLQSMMAPFSNFGSGSVSLAGQSLPDACGVPHLARWR